MRALSTEERREGLHKHCSNGRKQIFTVGLLLFPPLFPSSLQLVAEKKPIEFSADNFCDQSNSRTHTRTPQNHKHFGCYVHPLQKAACSLLFFFLASFTLSFCALISFSTLFAHALAIEFVSAARKRKRERNDDTKFRNFSVPNCSGS